MGTWLTRMRGQDGWLGWATVWVVLLLLPHVALVGRWFSEPPRVATERMMMVLLPEMIKNTLLLIGVVGLFVALIGCAIAWLVTAYEFPGRRFLRFALLLPLAIPPYVGAYTYHEMTNYTGVVQVTLRETFGVVIPPGTIDLMTLPGAMWVFIIFLFPYVYSVCYVFFGTRCAQIVETARMLGSRGFSLFVRVVIPLSRAAIVAGVSVVVLEVLNDYGVVHYFGIVTFTQALFQLWFGMGDLSGAMRLAGFLLLVVVLVLLLERMLRGRRQYRIVVAKPRPLRREPLGGIRGWLATACCAMLVLVGFAIPVVQLVVWAWRPHTERAVAELFRALGHSVGVAVVGAVLIVAIATMIANAVRWHPGWWSLALARGTLFGYAVPGAVIAVGVLSVLLPLETGVNTLLAYLGVQTEWGRWMSTSIGMLVCGYVMRFTGVGFQAVDAGFVRVGKSLAEASRSLGLSVTASFFRVDVPLMQRALWTAGVLCFVDIVKELPLSLLLQPYNFTTLATEVFYDVKDERIQDAALASLWMIALCAVGMIVLHTVMKKERDR